MKNLVMGKNDMSPMKIGGLGCWLKEISTFM